MWARARRSAWAKMLHGLPDVRTGFSHLPRLRRSATRCAARRTLPQRSPDASSPSRLPVVAITELGRAVCLALACRAARPAQLSAVQQRATAAMPCIALPCKLMCVCVRSAVRVLPQSWQRLRARQRAPSQRMHGMLTSSAAARPYYGASAATQVEEAVVAAVVADGVVCGGVSSGEPFGLRELGRLTWHNHAPHTSQLGRPHTSVGESHYRVSKCCVHSVSPKTRWMSFGRPSGLATPSARQDCPAGLAGSTSPPSREQPLGCREPLLRCKQQQSSTGDGGGGVAAATVVVSGAVCAV